MQSNTPYNSSEIGDQDTVMSSNDTTSTTFDGSNLSNNYFGGLPADSRSSSVEVDVGSERGRDAEDRRKFQRQESSQAFAQDSSNATHDPMTLDLGVGWISIGDDPDRQAAARGWAKFIDENYYLHNVEVLAYNTGKSSVLAKASGHFYVFDDDLRRGTCVAASWSECIEQLRSHPSLDFEEGKRLRAFESSSDTGYPR